MASRIDYTHDGCTGVLETAQRTNRPSSAGWALLVFLMTLQMLFLTPLWPLVPFVDLALVMLLALAQAPEGEVDQEVSYAWVWQVANLRTPITVERHFLHVGEGDDRRTVDLRDATVRSSDAGVYVTPARGPAVELYWDDATEESASVLAEALRTVAGNDHDRGTQQDVPVALKQRQQALDR